MNELTAALKEELNVDTAFTLPIFGGIDIPESIAVSWGIMAFLVIVSILLTRNLKVNHISKRQARPGHPEDPRRGLQARRQHCRGRHGCVRCRRHCYR